MRPCRSEKRRVLKAVRPVIADPGPVNYLVLIGRIEILPAMFEKVILPPAVRAELADHDAPPVVRNWIASPPLWLETHERRVLCRIP